jgi:hypothetical protein
MGNEEAPSPVRRRGLANGSYVHRGRGIPNILKGRGVSHPSRGPGVHQPSSRGCAGSEAELGASLRLA